jgi:hypothetical protein
VSNTGKKLQPTLSIIMSIYKNDDRRAWYLDGKAADGRVDQVLINATD